MPTTQRLTKDDWVDAALGALLAHGPDAVAVQPLARRIGATKGSFYWHFADRDDLLRATLQRWQQAGTEDVIAQVEAAESDPAQRARLLFRTVTDSSSRYPGQLLMLAATDHPDIAAALETVTRRRIAYVAQLLRATGQSGATATRRATLAYAVYLGQAQLAYSTPGVLPRSANGRRKLVDELTDVLLDTGGSARGRSRP